MFQNQSNISPGDLFWNIFRSELLDWFWNVIHSNILYLVLEHVRVKILYLVLEHVRVRYIGFVSGTSLTEIYWIGSGTC